MEAINNFSKGLHRSNSPITQPEGSYPDALNWVRNDEGRLTNEELEEITVSKPGNLVGSTMLNGEAICFFKSPNSEIGLYNFNSKTYTTLYNTNLNFGKYVDSTARVIFNNNRIVYFVDAENNLKYYNIDKNIVDNLLLDFSFPVIDNVSILETGNLPTGTYQIVARYVTQKDNKTNFGLPSKTISIVDNLKSEGREAYDGADPQSPSSKSITFNITNNDYTYPFIEIIIITYLGLSSTLVAYSLGIFANNSQTITYSSQDQHVYQVNISDINQAYIPYTKAKHIEQKDNILVLSNLETEEVVDFQTIANNINVYVKPENISFNENLSINFGTRPHTSDTLTGTVSLSSTNNFYTDYKNEFTPKSFQRGEIYSLFFIPIYKKGNIGNAFPIPAKTKTYNSDLGLNTTDVYTSTDFYPDNYVDIGGTNIKHHKIPDLDEFPLFSNNTITRFALYLNNINIPNNIKNKLQGYIIGYQKRDSSLNTRIVTEGVIRPYMWNGNIGFSPAFNGSSSMILNNNSEIDLQEEKPYYAFTSADEIHGYESNGNYLEYSGYYEGVSKLITAEPNGDPIQAAEFINATTFTPRFFSSKIIEAQDVPLSGVNNNSQINDGSTVIKIRGTKGFKHLKTSGPILGFSDLLFGGFTNYELNIHDRKYYTKSEWADHNVEPNYNLNDLSRVFTGRLLNTNTNQYGKIENAEVFELGNTFNIEDTSITIEGDTYIQKYSYYLNETFSPDNITNFTNNYFETKCLIYTFLESKNNFNYRHYNSSEVPYFPKYKTLYSLNEPLGLCNIFLEKGNSTGYNKQYSATNNIRAFFPKPSLFEDVTLFPNRSIYSEKSLEGELSDQMRIFLPNNFHDIPKNKGEITDTFVYNNSFYHHTERGLWKSFFNESTETATSSGNIILGNSGVFQLPSIELFTQEGGYAGTTSKAGSNTPFGRVFIDNNQGKVFLLNNTLVEISDEGLYSFSRKFFNPNDSYTSAYDGKNKRLLISNISKEIAISYYPKLNTWTSFHNFAPEKYLSSDIHFHAFSKDCFWNMENSLNDRKNSSITIIASSNQDLFARFENIQINTLSGVSNSSVKDTGISIINDFSFKENTFDYIQCWNEYQNSGKLEILLDKNFTVYTEYYNDKVLAKYYKGAYNMELPLDSVIDSNVNIFDETNLDFDSEFKQSLNSKFLYIKLDHIKTLPLNLTYIKTNFKPSIN